MYSIKYSIINNNKQSNKCQCLNIPIYLFIYFLVTIELIRKRSEHNEGEIGTLEEISLHQEDITKIENVQNWCKDLKILLLQSNLIFKIGK